MSTEESYERKICKYGNKEMFIKKNNNNLPALICFRGVAVIYSAAIMNTCVENELHIR